MHARCYALRGYSGNVDSTHHEQGDIVSGKVRDHDGKVLATVKRRNQEAHPTLLGHRQRAEGRRGVA